MASTRRRRRAPRISYPAPSRASRPRVAPHPVTQPPRRRWLRRVAIATGTFMVTRSAQAVLWQALNALLPGWPVLLTAAADLLVGLLR